MRTMKAKPFVIKDASSFYTTIKSNPLYSDLDDEKMIAALDDYFMERFKAARSDSLSGITRDRYMFFQGAGAGCLIMAKIFKAHIRAEAFNSNIDPKTGKSFATKDDAN